MAIKAIGHFLVLKVKELKVEDTVTTGSGLIIPNQGKAAAETSLQGKRGSFEFFFESIGNLVDPSLGLKVGQNVIVNLYNLQAKAGENDQNYGLCEDKDVKAIIE
jgi:co-chaperonin GroES (HSP10)